ncbi:MAG: ABC transporter permease [Chloroflexota bacterium]|nr:ABC transporter permease [Chloroflexota bacterium]
MQRYILRRALQGVVTLFVVTLVVFALGRLIGNPVDLLLPDDATEEDYQRIKQHLGLDKPIVQQLGIFYRNALRGDLGDSIKYRRPVTEIFFERFPNTAKLAPIVMLISIGIAIPLGVTAAFFRGRFPDKIATFAAVFGMATPNFWLGVVFIYIFAVFFRVLPAGGMEGPKAFILPGLTLGISHAASMMRLLRSSMLEVISSDYVRTARSKGLPNRMILLRHTMRNALIPVVTVGGMLLANLFAGTLVVETVFAWPGIGQLTYQAVFFRDYPLLQAMVIAAAILMLFMNLVVDILYGFLDPRIRYS